MKRQLGYLFLSCLYIAFFSVNAGAEIRDQFNITQDRVGIQGYDPVSYFNGEPQKGKAAHIFEIDGVTYRFVDGTNLAAFKENPKKYLPAYGGWCAWAMLDGEKVDIDPHKYKIINGVNYLFYDGFWGNTLKKWNKKAKASSDTDLVQQADTHWKEIVEENR